MFQAYYKAAALKDEFSPKSKLSRRLSQGHIYIMVEEKSEARVILATAHSTFLMSERDNVVEPSIQLLSSPDHPFIAIQCLKLYKMLEGWE